MRSTGMMDEYDRLTGREESGELTKEERKRLAQLRTRDQDEWRRHVDATTPEQLQRLEDKFRQGTDECQ